MPAQLISGNINLLPPDDLRNTLKECNISRIDTAARYQDGESERIIGRSGLSRELVVDTKILLSSQEDPHLSADAINKSIINSLESLQLDQVNVLYCHSMDWVTPIAETAQAFDEQYRAGRFKHAGVSNWTAVALQEWLDLADRNGWVKPSFYQGQYNLLCRTYEETLFPVLRKHGIAFAAYSPLAGGFLLGNFTKAGVQGGYRFTIQSPYTLWYDRPSMHEAVEKLKTVADSTGLGMDELSLRWLRYHSVLRDEDVIIVGASKVDQLKSSVRKAEAGPLEDSVVKDLDALWMDVKEDGAKIVDFDRKII